MPRGSRIDSDLQAKYRNTFERIFSEYFIPPKQQFVADIATAFLLKNSAVLLMGPPGTGKSTLLRLIAYQLTGSPDELAIVSCSEDQRPEDFVYDISIEQKKEAADVTKYEFTPLPRPFLTKTVGFLNECNRLQTRNLNFLLSILAERQLVVKGTLLKRVDGIIMMDMNPQVGGALPWPFVDRIRACLTVPALSLGHQLRLFKLKYGGNRHIEDLVAHAMKSPAMMSKDELFRVWEDVDKVFLDEDYASSILLFLNVFASCRYDLSEVHPAFKLDCSPRSCQFSDACVTKQLEHPVLTRSIDHVAKMLKAEAYFQGRDHVDLKTEILPSMKRVMLHRLAVKPEFSSKYATLEEWYEQECESRLVALQENWKQAKLVYDRIQQALATGKDEDAVDALNSFKEEAKDIVSVKMVEILEPEIEAASEKRFKAAYAKALALEKAGYTQDDLEELKACRFSGKFGEALAKVIRRLQTNLVGIIQVDEEGYQKLIKALAETDANVLTLVPFSRSYGAETHTFPDGSTMQIRKEYGKYVIEYDCKKSGLAKIFQKN